VWPLLQSVWPSIVDEEGEVKVYDIKHPYEYCLLTYHRYLAGFIPL